MIAVRDCAARRRLLASHERRAELAPVVVTWAQWRETLSSRTVGARGSRAHAAAHPWTLAQTRARKQAQSARRWRYGATPPLEAVARARARPLEALSAPAASPGRLLDDDDAANARHAARAQHVHLRRYDIFRTLL